MIELMKITKTIGCCKRSDAANFQLIGALGEAPIQNYWLEHDQRQRDT